MLELFKHFQFNFGYSLVLFCVYLSLSDRNCFGRPGRSILSNEDYPEEVTYPFQQYIQVRKEYTVEHLPSPHLSHDQSSQKSQPSNLEPSSASSTNRESDSDHEKSLDDYDQQEDKESHHYGRKSKYEGQDDNSSESEYTKPRLREEIEDYKKQEVYEEKGNSDGAYDHQGYAYGESHSNPYPKYEHADHHEHHNHNEPSSTTHNGEHRHHGGDDNNQNDNYTPAESESSLRNVKRKRNRGLYSSLHPGDGTSTKVLEYAASNLYDRDAHEKGIYRARDNIYCPEVIDFDLSSKKMRMGEGGNNPRGAKPRLVGLGGKITCLKNKYFGREPLPKAIFMDPEESRRSVIRIPTWEQFYKNVRTDVGSMSDFQRF